MNWHQNDTKYNPETVTQVEPRQMSWVKWTVLGIIGIMLLIAVLFPEQVGDLIQKIANAISG